LFCYTTASYAEMYRVATIRTPNGRILIFLCLYFHVACSISPDFTLFTSSRSFDPGAKSRIGSLVTVGTWTAGEAYRLLQKVDGTARVNTFYNSNSTAQTL